MTDLTGKSIVVTGAASGMGAEGAVRAARHGALVTAADLSAEAGERVVARIRAEGGQAQFVRTDIADEDDVERLVRAAVTAYGGLHGAYSNAGVPPHSSAKNGVFPLAELSRGDFRRAIDVNVVGTFLCLKRDIQALLASGGGDIVNTSSANGLVAGPAAADHVRSKHAVIGLTKAAARDHATQGVRVDAVLPGVIRTPVLTTASGGERQRWRRRPRSCRPGAWGSPTRSPRRRCG